eukprot:scaffold2196_cov33-Prasinocladus_malaysianus.AAC.1
MTMPINQEREDHRPNAFTWTRQGRLPPWMPAGEGEGADEPERWASSPPCPPPQQLCLAGLEGMAFEAASSPTSTPSVSVLIMEVTMLSVSVARPRFSLDPPVRGQAGLLAAGVTCWVNQADSAGTGTQ